MNQNYSTWRWTQKIFKSFTSMVSPSRYLVSLVSLVTNTTTSLYPPLTSSSSLWRPPPGNVLTLSVLSRPGLSDNFHRLLMALACFDTIFILAAGVNYSFRAFQVIIVITLTVFSLISGEQQHLHNPVPPPDPPAHLHRHDRQHPDNPCHIHREVSKIFQNHPHEADSLASATLWRGLPTPGRPPTMLSQSLWSASWPICPGVSIVLSVSPARSSSLKLFINLLKCF